MSNKVRVRTNSWKVSALGHLFFNVFGKKVREHCQINASDVGIEI